MSAAAPATLADMALIQALAEALLAQADKLGVTVMIERRSVPPLRMGGTEPVITVWPTRVPASPPAPAPTFEVVPLYENNEVVAWEVWRDRTEVRPGVWAGYWEDTFNNETDAIDYRAHLAKTAGRRS